MTEQKVALGAAFSSILDFFIQKAYRKPYLIERIIS